MRGIVLRHVGRVVLVGGVIGVAGGLAIGRASQSLLFQASDRDPAVIAAAALTLTLVALAAGYVPAWRTSRVNPAQALRGE